ncbi:MAG: hypothetical protein EON58_23255 [Alphaproteobacteria bacterium]|nr:MAG: hypothetical protein EON58_23255 [Alphaproteobacteria bacterium]
MSLKMSAAFCNAISVLLSILTVEITRPDNKVPSTITLSSGPCLRTWCITDEARRKILAVLEAGTTTECISKAFGYTTAEIKEALRSDFITG